MKEKVTAAIIAGQLVVGGAEQQLYLWLSHLDRQRFDPVVITLNPGDYWEKPIEDLGIPLIRVHRNRNRLARLIRIVRILRAYQPSLVHGWHTFSSVYAGFAGKILGIKSLGGMRSSYKTLESAWETRLMRLSLSLIHISEPTRPY